MVRSVVVPYNTRPFDRVVFQHRWRRSLQGGFHRAPRVRPRLRAARELCSPFGIGAGPPDQQV